jgi:phosphohistidine phosphatase
MKVYILRHAEAGAASTDGERPLTALGLEQARKAGQLLQPEQAQRLLFSPKLRTRQTAEQVLSVCTGLTSSPTQSLLPPSTEDDVAADLEAAQASGDSSVILVSHLPMVAELTGWLSTGDRADYPLPGYPPAGIVALQMDFIGPGAARLLWYAFPPDFEKHIN